MDLRKRCAWAASELMVRYHDEEWGVPQHEDRVLFEFLCLEGAQAGLSWQTILKKRCNYRLAFDDFQPELIAKYKQKKIDRLLSDSGIVRNRMKIASVVRNAQAVIAIQQRFGSFDRYIWQFAPKISDGRPPGNAPSRTAASDAMSKDLRRLGFGFVGSTICYAFMQAVGMVNDHDQACFRYREVERLLTANS
jgi:DNA-3-methyladenine glycosylase I